MSDSNHNTTDKDEEGSSFFGGLKNLALKTGLLEKVPEEGEEMEQVSETKSGIKDSTSQVSSKKPTYSFEKPDANLGVSKFFDDTVEAIDRKIIDPLTKPLEDTAKSFSESAVKVEAKNPINEDVEKMINIIKGEALGDIKSPLNAYLAAVDEFRELGEVCYQKGFNMIKKLEGFSAADLRTSLSEHQKLLAGVAKEQRDDTAKRLASIDAWKNDLTEIEAKKVSVQKKIEEQKISLQKKIEELKKQINDLTLQLNNLSGDHNEQLTALDEEYRAKKNKIADKQSLIEKGTNNFNLAYKQVENYLATIGTKINQF